MLRAGYKQVLLSHVEPRTCVCNGVGTQGTATVRISHGLGFNEQKLRPWMSICMTPPTGDFLLVSHCWHCQPIMYAYNDFIFNSTCSSVCKLMFQPWTNYILITVVTTSQKMWTHVIIFSKNQGPILWLRLPTNSVLRIILLLRGKFTSGELLR